MSKKFIITQLILLLCGLALALATYLAPSHAEERKHQLEQEQAVQQAQARHDTMPVASGR